MIASKITEHITTVSNFLSPEECLQFINKSEELGYELAKVNMGQSHRVNTRVRDNDRVFLNDPDLAQKLFERAKPFLPAQIGNSNLIGLNELFRFYRYQNNQRFKGHIDGSYIRNTREASYYTFMIYLNDGYEGGETIFLKDIIKPKQGMLLIFLHKLWHAGKEVTAGTKYVLRTDVMYRLND